MITIQRTLTVAALATIALATPQREVSAFTLPNPTTNTFQYGDFYSYSLPILAYQYDQVNGGGTGPGNPYYVASTPGQISNFIVIATGANGNPVNQNFAGMDNAYPTPNSTGVPTFTTGSIADPGQVGSPFTGDQAATWDSRISALTSFLGAGNSPVFFFNNNQVNSGAASNQNLYAWGQVSIRSTTGGAPTLYFDFANNNGTGPIPGPLSNVAAYTSPGAPTSNYPDAGGSGSWPQSSDFVLSGGQVCLDSTASSIVSCGTPGAIVFNHNLGANQAAYAITSPELNSFLASWTGSSPYDVISVDLRMTALNNGFEQLFIMPGTTSTNSGGGGQETVIPEPGSVLLLGFGLAAFGLYGRRRNRS